MDSGLVMRTPRAKRKGARDGRRATKGLWVHTDADWREPKWSFNGKDWTVIDWGSKSQKVAVDSTPAAEARIGR